MLPRLFLYGVVRLFRSFLSFERSRSEAGKDVCQGMISRAVFCIWLLDGHQWITVNGTNDRNSKKPKLLSK
jgi:hypothetical protein